MSESAAQPSAAAGVAGKTDADFERRLWRKITLRLIPFMFVLYVVNFLDRVNVSFAKLQMGQDLNFDKDIYAFGAGIFFWGYFLFEVPSNLIMRKTGARLWMARIMITWGIISCAMMFIKTPLSFYILRFSLGIAEAGFFPGMILYLTYWFPARERGKAVANFMTAIPVSLVIGSPISGALMEINWGGLAGWQWLFLLEGLPAVLLGVVVVFYLDDRPEEARWLTPEERAWLAAQLHSDANQSHQHHSFLQGLASGKVWLLSAVYLTLVTATYGYTLWLPQIIKGIPDLKETQIAFYSYLPLPYSWTQWLIAREEFWIGFLAAIPALATVVAMVLVGKSSDRTGERRWHVAVSVLLGAAGLVASAYADSVVSAIVLLSFAGAAMRSALAPFWALATSFLGGSAAAGVIALINSIGNLGGDVGPKLVAKTMSTESNFQAGLKALAVCLVLTAVLALFVPVKAARKKIGL